MASPLAKKLIGENYMEGPLMMAWHRLTGLLQKVESTKMSHGQFGFLRRWWDEGDLMLRRLAQMEEHPIGSEERLGEFPPGRLGEASILGAPQPGGEPAFNSAIPSGDSSITGRTVRKDADELPHDDEETRELKIADTILKTAHGMAHTPAVEEIIRQAEELKRIHGVQ